MPANNEERTHDHGHEVRSQCERGSRIGSSRSGQPADLDDRDGYAERRTSQTEQWPKGPFLGHEAWLGYPRERRLHFAGEQTSINAVGTMEGALQTGRRAADEVKRDWS
jgi:monoamine oxidase